MPVHFTDDTIILDASCLISLYASKQIEGILKAVPSEVAVAAYVADREALWVPTQTVVKGRRTREPINLRPFADVGLLKVVSLETEIEAEIMATLVAQRLDQGEAITGAIAIHREWSLVTDDRRAHRVFQQRAQHLQLIFTLELVKHWSELNSISPDFVSATLHNIREMAVYTPHKQHPLYEWWHKHGGG